MRPGRGRQLPKRGRQLPASTVKRVTVDSDYAIHISQLDNFSRRIAKSGAFIYPSLHCSILHVTSFDIWGVPVALSTSTGEHGFTPVVALFSSLGGRKTDRVRAAFRRAALRAHMRVFPAHVDFGGVVRVVLLPPAVIRRREKSKVGPPVRVRASRGALAARDSPLTCLTAYAAPRQGLSAPAVIPPTSERQATAAKVVLPTSQALLGTSEPLRSVFWRPGRGGRLRLGWVLSGRSGIALEGVPRHFMIDELFRRRGQPAGDYSLRVVPCRRIVVAIELLLLSAALEDSQLFAAHCLLTSGTRILMCGRRSDSLLMTSHQLQDFGAQSPSPIVGSAAPMFLFRDFDRTPGAAPLFVDGTHVYRSDGTPHPMIGNAIAPIHSTTRRCSVAPVRSDARRLLLNMLPACSKANRDLVSMPLAAVSLTELLEIDVAAWVAVHASDADAEYTRGLHALQNRRWCVAIRHGTSYLPIGWAAWHEGTLDALYVNPQHRRQHLGRKLLLHAVTATGGSITAPWVTGPSGGLKKMVQFAPFEVDHSSGSPTMAIRSSGDLAGVAVAAGSSLAQ